MEQTTPTPIGKLLPTLTRRTWKMPPDFDEITLTEEETEYALYDARCEKYFAQKEQIDKERKAKELLDCLTPFTSVQLREYVLKKHPNFIVDQQSEKHLTCYASILPMIRNLKRAVIACPRVSCLAVL